MAQGASGGRPAVGGPARRQAKRGPAGKEVLPAARAGGKPGRACAPAALRDPRLWSYRDPRSRFGPTVTIAAASIPPARELASSLRRPCRDRFAAPPAGPPALLRRFAALPAGRPPAVLSRLVKATRTESLRRRGAISRHGRPSRPTLSSTLRACGARPGTSRPAASRVGPTANRAAPRRLAQGTLMRRAPAASDSARAESPRSRWAGRADISRDQTRAPSRQAPIPLSFLLASSIWPPECSARGRLASRAPLLLPGAPLPRLLRASPVPDPAHGPPAAPDDGDRRQGWPSRRGARGASRGSAPRGAAQRLGGRLSASARLGQPWSPPPAPSLAIAPKRAARPLAGVNGFCVARWLRLAMHGCRAPQLY